MNMLVLCRDEDMQSIASLMSIGRTSDIANMEEMEDEETDEATLKQRRDTKSQISEIASLMQSFHQDDEDTNGNLFDTSSMSSM